MIQKRENDLQFKICKAFGGMFQDNASKCRGFGYVQFVLQDDADKAVAAEIKIDDRILKISYAMKKPKHSKRKLKTGDDDEEQISNDEAETSHEKPPPPIQKKTLQKGKEKDIGKPVSISQSIYKHPTTNQSQKQIDTQLQRTVVLTGLTGKVKRKAFRILCEKFGDIENIVYPVPEREEVTAFVRFKDVRGAVRASQKLSGQKVKKSNVLSAVLLNKEGKPASKKVLQQSRIIVRNMSFKCEETDLNECFSKFGKIVHIHIPTKRVGEKVVKVGLAFIQYANPKNAESAIKAMNLQKIKDRPVVVDWAIDKETYKEKSRQEIEKSKKSKADASKDDDDDDNDTGNVSEGNDSHNDNDDDVDDDEESDAADSIEHSDGDDDNDSDNDDDKDEDDDDDGDDDDSNDDDDDSDDDESEKRNTKEQNKKKTYMKDAKEGKTIFIRNLAYETEEETLTEEFEKFGDIDSCKIVMDHATGRSKGSAFIKFISKESADKCVSELIAREEKGKNLMIEGRPVKVSIAVTQGKVMEIERQKKTANKETDKRNLSLAYEGVITKNTPGADALSDSDLKKREKALEEKKRKLKDPNYFVSRTRLCFRNLPLNVDKKALQNALIKQIADLHINNIKIMRNKERKDSEGVPRSLGFGFVELANHEQALRLLRITNNNPEIFGENRRPIVDFSVESIKALKILEARKSSNENNTNDKKRKFYEKKLKRIEKFKQRREDRKQNSEKDNSDVKKSSKTNSKASIPKQLTKPKAKTIKEKHQRTQTLGVTDKNDTKFISRTDNRKRDKFDERKRKRAKNNEDEEKFKGMVNSYKKKILGNETTERKIKESRWFE